VDSKVHLPNGDPVPSILLANKCDLESRAISVEDLDNFVKENGFIGWVETSAKNNTNINMAMKILLVVFYPLPQ